MIPTRRFFIFLAILVMLPFMAGRLLAAQNQDEGLVEGGRVAAEAVLRAEVPYPWTIVLK